MNYEAIIGLEVHAQMLTGTKIFCGCSTKFGSEPNTQTCPVCIGMPGVLPVLNTKALEFSMKTGFAMNCRISPYSRFARKNYFYPDLPKGYQISQYELPICEHGYIEIVVDGSIKKIGITRIHMEEDAGKNIHDSGAGGGNFSFVDLNRTGVPLMEIVSEPDMRTPVEAVEYMKKLRAILRALDVCDGNMEQGSLRCDANVSVRPVGHNDLGVKVEIKNINSFRFVEKALEYEIKRQVKVLSDGGTVVQETRLWDSSTGTTQSMRTKEEAHDYRYFPDPDLVPIMVDQKWLDEIRESLPELPDAKKERFISEYKFSEYDAELFTSEKLIAEPVEAAVKQGAKTKHVSNFMPVYFNYLNKTGKEIDETPIKPAYLVDLSNLVETAVVSGSMAKTVLYESIDTGRPPSEIVKEKGLSQISDTDELEKMADEVIAKNPKEVERFKEGEQKLLGFFVGQVMKATKGKANPQMVNELLRKKLS
jgi:aspartyl-tRNA(Asn)/glutamyl-tRNA(Gln) amidotransferase subunit B